MDKDVVNKLYYSKINFLNNFLLNGYGSALDLYDKASNIVKWYYTEDLLNEKLNSLKAIKLMEIERQNNKKDEKERLFSKKIEKISFLIVILFGLPVIHDILLILRRMFKVKDMLPGSIEGYSFIIWIILIFISYKFLDINEKV